MENLDKELTVPKWVPINCHKIPQNFSAQIVCPSAKVWNFDENRLLRASVVRKVTKIIDDSTTDDK